MLYIKIPNGLVLKKIYLMNGILSLEPNGNSPIKHDLILDEMTKQIKDELNKESPLEHDILLNEKTNQIIDIQGIVKEYLRDRDRSKDCYITDHQGKELEEYDTDSLIIYHHKPPMNATLYLYYKPGNNGKEAAISSEWIQGNEAHTPNAKALTHCGQRWFRETPLNPKRKASIIQRDSETRESRRHQGPSPMAT